MSSIKMKKLVNIKGVIDNIRQSVNTPSPTSAGSGSSPTPGGPAKLEADVVENTHPGQFVVENTVRHGFPHKPISMAFDPVQRLLAIGNRSGIVRILGKPGVEVEIAHEGRSVQVLQIEFLHNTGRLLTACTDDTINLWEFKKKAPEVVHSLQLSREHLTAFTVEFQDKWLYVGTEKGNVLVMNLETFTLSGYQISWNKGMDPMQKNHPGAVSHLAVNPADPSKLLIGYTTGLVTLWDLPTKKGELRYQYQGNQNLRSFCWNMDGKQLVCAYGDGSLVTWNLKGNKPQSVQFPHGKRNKETGKLESRCDPIDKVLWKVHRSSGENVFVFSGGLPSDVTGVTPSITIMQGKSTTLLEMEYSVIDFLLVTDSPYGSDYQTPEAVIVMLNHDLVAIDCKSPGYPCFKNPYAMDINESAVTCCRYVVDCPGDFISGLYRVGLANSKSEGFSSGEWPICGGKDGDESCSYQELIVTGHADGSVRFWDTSSTTMLSLYRIKTLKYFEKAKPSSTPPSSAETGSLDSDPYAITQISICPNSKDRELAVTGASGQVVFFRFKPKETQTETKFMEIPIVYEVSPIKKAPASSSTGGEKDGESIPSPQHFEFPSPKPLLNVASQSASYTDPVDGFNFDKPQYEYFSPFRLRPGSQRKSPGFHAELVCLTPWVNGEAPSPLGSLALNTNYGLMAYGNGSGLVIVDIVQFVCLLNMGTADLYGSLDPFQRMPKSPKVLGAGDLEIVKVDLGNYSQVESTNAGSSAGSNEKTKLIKTGSGEQAPGSLSKSHSSSTNSLDQLVTGEGISALYFVDSFQGRNDFTMTACLYVGTSLGSFIAIVINLPDKGEARLNEPVVVSPSGSLFRLRGNVLATCFLDCSSNGLSRSENVYVPFKPKTKSEEELASATKGDQQLMAVCTDRVAYVYALPSQKQMYSQSIGESNSASIVSANIVNFSADGNSYAAALVCYTSDGNIKAFSIPALRPMVDVYFTALSSPRIGITMKFSDFGHAIYFCTATEIQKFSLSGAFLKQLPSLTGSVFSEGIPDPEPPKQSFLSIGKGLFGGGPKPLDREELFGESAGKVGTNVVKHLAGSNMQKLQGKSVASGSEVGKAHAAFLERGQKLNEVEERTEQMANEAKQYATNAHRLMLDAKNKKWYQL